MDDKYIEDLFNDKEDIKLPADKAKKPATVAPKTENKGKDEVFSQSDIDALVMEHTANPKLTGVGKTGAGKTAQPAATASGETGSIIAPRRRAVTANSNPSTPKATARPANKPTAGATSPKTTVAKAGGASPAKSDAKAEGANSSERPRRTGTRPTARRMPATAGSGTAKKAVAPSQTDKTVAVSAPKKEALADLKPAKAEKNTAVAPDTKGKKARKSKNEYEKGGIGSSLSTLAKALIYMGAVIAIAIVISTIGIKFANDCFAFVKDDYETTVTITDGATVSEIADTLYENDIIGQPSAFRLWVGYKYSDAELEFEGGDYVLNSNLNYDQIISKIRKDKTPVREIVTISFPEGSTVDDIIDTLVEKGIGTREGYVDAINNYDYDYKFMEYLKKEKLRDSRKYRLEGYLFPDTYEFYTDSSEVAVIDRFLSTFEKIFTEADYSRLNELNYSLDEVITVASIVQHESKYANEFYTTASVFFNRLKSKDFPKLESDATVQYCLDEHVEHITAELRVTDSEYNTYMYNGLPPSAICNPGIDAITAALYPEETGYYYFFAGEDGYNIFSKTYSEHLKIVAAGGKK